MNSDNYLQEQKYLRAKKRVEDLKGFYTHLAVYVAVNLFISITRIVQESKDGFTIAETLSDFGTFAIWIFWGIGVLFHGLKTFGFNFLMGKDWEERKIKEYLKEKNR
ncbi:MAG: 2TM domain-containing protein [Flavobacteriaceae bacterium]